MRLARILPGAGAVGVIPFNAVCRYLTAHKGVTVNKQDLIEKIALAAELNKAAATRTLDVVLDSISEALKSGDTVTLAGFGTFSVTNRAARTGRNPRTGESIAIAASKNPKFKAGKGLKDAVN